MMQMKYVVDRREDIFIQVPIDVFDWAFLLQIVFFDLSIFLLSVVGYMLSVVLHSCFFYVLFVL
ncbi:hypothetical protein C4565_03270 [Candidatus Parcubacteria bacterium]|nr:MAG: hypothetical protein C4565_03270 [Candidatus Parcubacteria bacterium]